MKKNLYALTAFVIVHSLLMQANWTENKNKTYTNHELKLYPNCASYKRKKNGSYQLTLIADIYNYNNWNSYTPLNKNDCKTKTKEFNSLNEMLTKNCDDEFEPSAIRIIFSSFVTFVYNKESKYIIKN